uniref:Uncharacterized protein n=1 Tax=Pseudictyota dubia TaxID=2749911 RepID=A0A7R9WK83_9STRA|mmetsp:Transcript_7033/g.12682  ORF Transcript_7033/g.12682 Transcript_7033/m.12682 type:complete len:193 (+) Transcript_7033:464-1042(+)
MGWRRSGNPNRRRRRSGEDDGTSHGSIGCSGRDWDRAVTDKEENEWEEDFSGSRHRGEKEREKDLRKGTLLGRLGGPETKTNTEMNVSSPERKRMVKRRRTMLTVAGKSASFFRREIGVHVGAGNDEGHGTGMQLCADLRDPRGNSSPCERSPLFIPLSDARVPTKSPRRRAISTMVLSTSNFVLPSFPTRK